jgi:excisionase family DNA binding protein
MTVREAAARLEVSESLIYKLCAAGRLAHHRIGLGRGTIRIEPESVEALKRECRAACIPAAKATRLPKARGGKPNLRYL